jgi:CHAT domain-containing protein
MVSLCLACEGRYAKPRTTREEIAEALGAVRPSPGRLSGLRYAPHARTYSPPRTNRQIQIVGLHVRKKAERMHSAGALGDQAVLNLAMNRLDRSIADLEEAVRQAPADAGLLSDLSACYLARGDRGEAYFYVKALDAAKRARRADRHQAAVLFNWALALERNYLNEEADAAWADYLRLDSDSPWAQEASERLAILEQPSRREVWSRLRPELDRAALRGDERSILSIVRAFPYQSRTYAEEELLPGWAEAITKGRYHEATKLLEIARRTGQALAAAHGEPLVADAVAAVDHATLENRSAAELASVERILADGRALCKDNQGIQGTSLLLGVREAAARVQSPTPEIVEFYLASCSYARSDYLETISLLEELLRRPVIERYPSLMGQVHWLRGLAYLSLAKPMVALRSYEAAVAAFERTGSAEEVGSVSYLIADNLRYLGDLSGAWRWLFRSLTETMRNGDVRALYAAFDELADDATRQGLGEAALLFRSEVVRLAFRESDAPGITHALLRLGQAQWHLGHRLQGLQALSAAERRCAQIPDADARRRWQADVLIAEGNATADPLGALPLLSRGIEFYRGDGDRFHIVEAYLARAQVYQALGDNEAGERDLLAGVEEFERQRGEIPKESMRLSYFAQARDLFDLLIEATASRPDGAEPALAYAERERARVLLDRLGNMGSSPAMPRRTDPFAPAALRQQLPEGVALIEYAVLQDRLLLWVIRRGRVQMVTSPAAPKAVQDLVHHFRRGLEQNRPEAALSPLSADLHTALIAPALPWIRPEDTLIFVPDKSLHLVPFAALRNPNNKRYLIEDHAIGVSPSATLFLRSLERSRSLGNSPFRDALVVGQPNIDLSRFQSLGRLDWGAQELSQVAAIYGDGAEVLTAERATPRSVLARAGEHAIVHLGSHALANESVPALAGLILTPASEEDTGILFAWEIENAPFKRTRLVVLAACDTASGADEAEEGVLSLSRSFLAAGVPSVIASLWWLNDRATSLLAMELHRNIKAGKNSIEALRQAQLSILHQHPGKTASPGAWASMEHFGGALQAYQEEARK